MARTFNSLTETQIKNLPPVQKEKLFSDGNNLFLCQSPTGSKVWHIPAHKMKGRKGKKRPHDVPLSDPAIAILEEMKKHNAHKKYIFAHRLKPDLPCHSETANNTIKSIGYKDKLTAHGMRAIASTYLNEIGENPFIVEACLAHIMGNEVHKAYNRGDYLDLRRPVMQKWGEYVEQCDKS